MRFDKKFYDILKIIMNAYEIKGEITLDRIIFTFYLVDWKSSLDQNSQITSVNWRKFNQTFTDFLTASFKKSSIEGGYYFRKPISSLNHKEVLITENIIEKTIDLNEMEIMQLVMSTFPMTSSKEDVDLNLVAKAQEYKSDYSFIK